MRRREILKIARMMGEAARKQNQKIYDDYGLPKNHPARQCNSLTLIGCGRVTRWGKKDVQL